MSDKIEVEEVIEIVSGAALEALKAVHNEGDIDPDKSVNERLEEAAKAALCDLAGSVVEIVTGDESWECPAEKLDVALDAQKKGHALQFDVQLSAPHPRHGTIQL